MSQSISVRREGDVIFWEDLEDTPDHKGVLKSTILNADDALWLGTELIQMGWEAKGDEKRMSLAVVSDPYPEDRQ